MVSDKHAVKRFESLVAPLPLEEIMRHCRSLSLLIHHGNPGSFSLIDQLLPDDREGIFALADREESRVRLIGMRDGQPAGYIARSSLEAKRGYRSGWSLLVDKASTVINTLQPWEAAVEVALGMPKGTCEMKISVSARDSGLPQHFDRYETIQLQLHGTKQWLVAKNEDVSAPYHSHMVGLPVTPELSSYCLSPISNGPRDLHTIMLHSGSLLFVPRGYWHGTSAGDEGSISLIIRCAAPARLHLLARDRHPDVSGDVRWRMPVYGGWNGHPDTPIVAEELSALMHDSRMNPYVDGRKLITRFRTEEYIRDQCN